MTLLPLDWCYVAVKPECGCVVGMCRSCVDERRDYGSVGAAVATIGEWLEGGMAVAVMGWDDAFKALESNCTHGNGAQP